MKLKKCLALMLAGVLLLGSLTACGAPQPPAYNPETLDTTTITDLTEFLMGVPGDTAVATLNGEAITADELAYWIVAYCDNAKQNAYQSTGTLDIPWGADMGEGKTLEAFIREDALNLAVTQRMVAQMAAKDGLTLTQEQLDTVQKILDAIAAEGQQQIGATLEQYLRLSMAVGEKLFRWNWECDFLYEALRQSRFSGEGEPEPEEILSWLEDEGLYRVKHILISTQGITDTEKIKEKRAKADDLLTQLLAAEDPIALFDQLMNEHGEDPGVAENPDGYVAEPGQMVTEFEQAALHLEPGKFSDVVTSQFGYHIILRLPLEVDVAQYKDAYISSAMAQLVAGMVEQSKLKTTAICKTVNVQDVYKRMTDYRNRFGQPPVEAVEPVEGDSSAAQ